MVFVSLWYVTFLALTSQNFVCHQDNPEDPEEALWSLRQPQGPCRGVPPVAGLPPPPPQPGPGVCQGSVWGQSLGLGKRVCFSGQKYLLIDWLYQSLTAHQHQKGHTVPKQVESTRKECYSSTVWELHCLRTALCESICYQAKSEQTVRQDLIPRVRHGEAALMHPDRNI